MRPGIIPQHIQRPPTIKYLERQDSIDNEYVHEIEHILPMIET